MLKHCAAYRKRWLSALPNVGPYTYDVKISGFIRSSIYIYAISRLRVKSVARHAELGPRNACKFVLLLIMLIHVVIHYEVSGYVSRLGRKAC
jgi:hypothetical protein